MARQSTPGTQLALWILVLLYSAAMIGLAFWVSGRPEDPPVWSKVLWAMMGLAVGFGFALLFRHWRDRRPDDAG